MVGLQVAYGTVSSSHTKALDEQLCRCKKSNVHVQKNHNRCRNFWVKVCTCVIDDLCFRFTILMVTLSVYFINESTRNINNLTVLQFPRTKNQRGQGLYLLSLIILTVIFACRRANTALHIKH